MDRVSVVPMVLEVLVHAGIFDGDVQREEVLDDAVTLGGDIRRSAVAEEEIEHVDAEGLGSHVERREAVTVAGVGVGAAVAQWSTALKRRLGAAQGIGGDHAAEDLRVKRAAEAHEVRPADVEIHELLGAVLGHDGA